MTYISRNYLLGHFQDLCNGTKCADCMLCRPHTGCRLERFLIEAPEPFAEWVEDDENHEKCSACGRRAWLGETSILHYCPNCGRKMYHNKALHDAYVEAGMITEENNDGKND